MKKKKKKVIALLFLNNKNVHGSIQNWFLKQRCSCPIGCQGCQCSNQTSSGKKKKTWFSVEKENGRLDFSPNSFLKPRTHGQNIGRHLPVQKIPVDILPVCMFSWLLSDVHARKPAAVRLRIRALSQWQFPVRTQQLSRGDYWTNFTLLVLRLLTEAVSFFSCNPMKKGNKRWSYYLYTTFESLIYVLTF